MAEENTATVDYVSKPLPGRIMKAPNGILMPAVERLVNDKESGYKLIPRDQGVKLIRARMETENVTPEIAGDPVPLEEAATGANVSEIPKGALESFIQLNKSGLAELKSNTELDEAMVYDFVCENSFFADDVNWLIARKISSKWVKESTPEVVEVGNDVVADAASKAAMLDSVDASVAFSDGE